MNDDPKFDQSRYKFWTDDHVRFSDLDPLGHVNNNAIGQYFENARASMFMTVSPEWPTGAQIFVLAKTIIDFRAELHMPADLRIGLGILKVGRTSLTLSGALFHGNKGIATCENVSVLIDRATRKPTEIPQHLREAASKYLIAA